MKARVDLTGLTPVERELLRLGMLERERSEGDQDVAVQLLDRGDRRALRADAVPDGPAQRRYLVPGDSSLE